MRIDVQDDGETIIPDPVFAQWRQLVVVTPSRRLRPYDDFASDLRYESARVTQKLPDGGVRSSSVRQGSRYVLDLTLPEPAIQSMKSKTRLDIHRRIAYDP